ncbi:hypothetical protein K9L97_02765 [Candidatus Woesearchaeota archaeon]|nr:hypothetical protein [Candidatus Woesearchaeota archaeon]
MNKKIINAATLSTISLATITLTPISLTASILSLIYSYKGTKQGKKENCKKSITTGIITLLIASTILTIHLQHLTHTSLQIANML